MHNNACCDRQVRTHMIPTMCKYHDNLFALKCFFGDGVLSCHSTTNKSLQKFKKAATCTRGGWHISMQDFMRPPKKRYPWKQRNILPVSHHPLFRACADCWQPLQHFCETPPCGFLRAPTQYSRHSPGNLPFTFTLSVN